MKLRIILIFIFLGLFSATDLHAQQVSQGAYKSWQYFKPDTTAYLKYNWDSDSGYNDQLTNMPLKTFFDTLELPVTVVEFKLIDRFIVGLLIYVTPYEKVMSIPLKNRSQNGLTLVFSPHYIVAAPYEEKIPQLKIRDKKKVDRIFVKWNPTYNKIIENLKFDYIVY